MWFCYVLLSILDTASGTAALSGSEEDPGRNILPRCSDLFGYWLAGIAGLIRGSLVKTKYKSDDREARNREKTDIAMRLKFSLVEW